MPKRLLEILLVLALGALLGACTSTETKDGDGQDQADVLEGSDAPDASTKPLTDSGTFAGDPLDDPASLLAKRIVFFAYDSSTVLDTDRPVVEAHAVYLAENENASVTLEGHADERGTREYNIGLGDRRTQSIRQLMLLLGAAGRQLRTVSYGEERPAVDGHDEFAWQQNRRVEIIYRSR